MAGPRTADAPAGEDILDLADGHGLQAAFQQDIQHRFPRREHGVVAAVGRAGEIPGAAGERTGDHPADPPFVADLPGAQAHFIKVGQRHDLLVGRDLQHAVGRSVDDGKAAAHVLGAELGDDLGPRGGLVPQDAGRPGPPFEIVKQFAGKPLGKKRERPIQNDAHQFPMAGDGVLAPRSFRHAPPGSPRRRRGGHAAHGNDVSQPKLLQVRQFQPAATFGDVAQGVRADIAVFGGIGKRADADRVQDNEEHAVDFLIGHRFKYLTQRVAGLSKIGE